LLESRRVMAGNVTAAISRGGDLTIDGDELGNQIQVRRSGFSSVVISSLDGTTTINGRTGPIALRGFRDDVSIRMGEGDDVVRLQGSLFSPFTVFGTLSVDMGGGADSLLMTHNTVFGTTNLNLGSGRDTVEITRSSFLGRFALNMGEGNDGANVNRSTFIGISAINGGEGIDGLIRSSNRSFPPLKFFSIEGAQPGGGPTANADTGAVTEGGTTTINVAANDVPNEGTLVLSSITITQQPLRGTVTPNPDGTVTYVHNGSEQTTDAFRYTIRDSLGNTSNAALVTVAIANVNDAPIADDEAVTVNEGASVAIDVANGDTDPEGQLDLGSVEIVDQPDNGTVSVNPTTGVVTYTHNGSETTSDSFTYRIFDSANPPLSDTATVTITVNPVNDAPVAVNDGPVTVLEGGSVVIDVAANDTDAEGPVAPSTVTITDQPDNGMVSVNPTTGEVTYTHNGSETLADSFSYTIKDGPTGLVSNVATVAITVTPVDDPVNQPPTADNDSATVAAGGSVVVNIADGDTDPDGSIDTRFPESIVITDQPDNGTIVVHPTNGTVTYTHNGSTTTSDSFRYTIKDDDGAASNEATVTITIDQAQNEDPTAGPDMAEVEQSGSVDIDLVANDEDPEDDLDLGSIEIVEDPEHGFVEDNGDGTVTYFHNGDAETTDSFSYRIFDGDGNPSNVAVVSITVTPSQGNTPPEGIDDLFTITENTATPVTGNVLDNDIDEDGDDLFVTAVEGEESNVGTEFEGLFGTLTLNADGTFTYELDVNNPEIDALEDGEEEFDTFFYEIGDGTDFGFALLDIRITGVSD
jgi:large repetitive protein